VPNIFLGGVMGYIALSCAWELWQTGDPKLMWGRTTQAAAVECGTWFMVFVGMDTLLSILHGDMDKETAVHHGAARLHSSGTSPAPPHAPGHERCVRVPQPSSPWSAWW
jgi:hypothetical protein